MPRASREPSPASNKKLLPLCRFSFLFSTCLCIGASLGKRRSMHRLAHFTPMAHHYRRRRSSTYFDLERKALSPACGAAARQLAAEYRSASAIGATSRVIDMRRRHRQPRKRPPMRADLRESATTTCCVDEYRRVSQHRVMLKVHFISTHYRAGQK